MIETQEFTNTYKTMDDHKKNSDQEPMPIANHKCSYYLYIIIDTIVSIIAIAIYYIRVQPIDSYSLVTVMLVWGIFNLIFNIMRITCAYGIVRLNWGYPRNNQLIVICVSLGMSALLVLLVTLAFIKNIYNTDLKQDLILAITWYSLYGYNIIVIIITACIILYYSSRCQDCCRDCYRN